MTRQVAKRMVVRHPHDAPRAFVLYWDFGDRTCLTAEGYCSRPYFKTAREAKAYAHLRFNEKAALVRW